MKKKVLSLLLTLVMTVSMMTGMPVTSYAAFTDVAVQVGETKTISRYGIFSEEVTDGNCKEFTSSDEDKLEIVDVSQDGDDIVVTVKGLEETEEEEFVNIECKRYNENTSEWEDWVFYLGIHVVEADEEGAGKESELAYGDDPLTEITESCEYKTAESLEDECVWGFVSSDEEECVFCCFSHYDLAAGNIREDETTVSFSHQSLEGACLYCGYEAASGDDDELTGDGDDKTFDQIYNLTDLGGDDTDVIRVKLSWEISDIDVTRVNNRIWDTESLSWVEDGDPVINVQNEGSAKFTLENYSSVEMDVTAEFEAESGFDPEVTFDEETGEDGMITLETANGSEIYDENNVPTGSITVTVTPGEDDFKGKPATDNGARYGKYTITITEHADEGWCLAAGTKIRMTDGTEKNIEDIVRGEQVMTFNHEKGIYEAQNVRFSYHGGYTKRPFTLHFDNGSELSIVGLHDLFEKESLKYVPVTEEDAEDFIGKHFYCSDDGAYVALESVTYETEAVDFYTVYTDCNENCIANGMLTLPDDVDSLLNIYEFHEDLTADQAQLERDIAEFGLYEYPEDAAYSEEQFDAIGAKYALIMVGKGLCTMEEISTAISFLLAAL